MDWATRRKIQYLSILVAGIIVFFVIPFYVFIYKAPTCFDNLKNGDETGVDCGGACELVCSSQIAEPISRWDPRVFKVSDGTYSVLAYLENPNVTAEVANAPYTFKLFDKDNILVSERSGTTLIPRGQTFALYEPNISTGERVPTRAVFEFGKNLTWVKNTAPQEDITVTSKALSREDSTPRVDAVVVNNGTTLIPHIEFVAIVYDGAGNAIGASKTFVNDLVRGSTKSLVFTWPQPFTTKSDSCDQPVDVALVLDRSGSMASLGENPPQPLTDVKTAAAFFVGKLRSTDQVSLVTFANEASSPIDSNLSSDFKDVAASIDAINIAKNGLQNTNIADAIAKAREELLSPRHKNNSQKVMITLTDGVANRPERSGDAAYAETIAQSEADIAKQSGIAMYSIGLGKDINANFLARIASSTDEFYLAPTTETLTNIYSQIATKICKRRPAVIEVLPRVIPK
jgi:Mg-chelatase subunit ChlD